MTKTQWTLVITILIAVANAIVPFLPTDIQAGITAILAALALTFHVQDVNQAVAQAKAPKQ